MRGFVGKMHVSLNKLAFIHFSQMNLTFNILAHLGKVEIGKMWFVKSV